MTYQKGLVAKDDEHFNYIDWDSGSQMRMPQPQAKFEIAKDEMEEEIIPSTYILHVPT
jgi:hypothetical protein